MIWPEMDEANGMAIPLPDEEGAVAGRRRAYESQLLARKIRAQLTQLFSGLTLLDWSVKVFSAAMLLFPFYVFEDYLHRGVLFISPPLFFMFVAGVVGWFLPPIGRSAEESMFSERYRQ